MRDALKASLIAQRNHVLWGCQRLEHREAELREAGATWITAPVTGGNYLQETMDLMEREIAGPARWEFAYHQECDYIVVLRIAEAKRDES